MVNELKNLLIEADIYATPYTVINDDAVYEKMAEYLVAKGVKVCKSIETSAVTDKEQIEKILKSCPVNCEDVCMLDRELCDAECEFAKWGCSLVGGNYGKAD